MVVYDEAGVMLCAFNSRTRRSWMCGCVPRQYNMPDMVIVIVSCPALKFVSAMPSTHAGGSCLFVYVGVHEGGEDVLFRFAIFGVGGGDIIIPGCLQTGSVHRRFYFACALEGLESTEYVWHCGTKDGKTDGK